MTVPSLFDTTQGSERLAATRQGLHRVAEWLLAGPQYRDQGTIRLQVVPGGFATVDGQMRVDGDHLVTADGRRVPLTGTLESIAADAGVVGTVPVGLYTDSSGAKGDDHLDIDGNVARYLADWMERGTAALRVFAPGETPVLWPEHFDVGVASGEVNYGISLGDAHQPEPYAYVGPWTPREGDFWNEPFGAARTWRQLADEASVVEFFSSGKVAAG